MAFATLSEDKEEPKKTGKKKEVTCFRCKKVGHYASECGKELPPKMPKAGSNMLIADKESSNGQEQDTDDDTDDDYGRYEGAEGNKHDGGQVNDANTMGSTDDTETEDEEEDIKGQFDDDYEGIVFTQDILCNVQEKAWIT